MPVHRPVAEFKGRLVRKMHGFWPSAERLRTALVEVRRTHGLVEDTREKAWMAAAQKSELASFMADEFLAHLQAAREPRLESALSGALRHYFFEVGAGHQSSEAAFSGLLGALAREKFGGDQRQALRFLETAVPSVNEFMQDIRTHANALKDADENISTGRSSRAVRPSNAERSSRGPLPPTNQHALDLLSTAHDFLAHAHSSYHGFILALEGKKSELGL